MSQTVDDRLTVLAQALDATLGTRIMDLIDADSEVSELLDLRARTQRAEDLAAECRRQLRSRDRQCDNLTALLASRDARLAAVEALADEKHEPPIDLIHERCPAGGVGPGRECTACSAAGRAYLIGVEHVQRDLRAALRSDPDEASADA